MQALLKSEQSWVQETIKQAVTAALQGTVVPTNKRIAALEAKILNFESNLASVI